VISPGFREHARQFAGAVSHGITPSGTERFRVLREKGIGGSEIAAVMGLSPFESPFSIWHRKARPGTGFGDVVETEAMYWGTVDEPNIARRFGELHPEYAVVEAPLYTSLERPWQIASPDRILVDVESGRRSVLEIKTARYDDHWRDGPPVHYVCQVQWYLDVLGLDEAVIACRFGGAELREYAVRRSDDDIATMREVGQAFMDSLKSGEAPPLDGHTATYKTVRALPEGLEDVDIEISAEDAHAYARAVVNASGAERVLRSHKAHMLSLIGAGHRAVCGGVTVATRTVRDGKTHSLIAGKNLGDFLGGIVRVCACGEPDSRGVVHRVNGPCYLEREG
jgi:putative phage-type endonuclease